ncbi:hypothetical protein Tco_1109869 [Tanacetum coccineum]|uniref:Uncharacterized protein n=1 Tax=Tanacetum coccineum TaxID=301880 RepID=A0ABQ5IH76_9ASTR
MDDVNLTMEAYIELEVEKSRRHDLENDSIKVNVSSDDIVIEQSKNGIDANVDTQSDVFDKDFETNRDIHSEPFNMKDYIIMIKVVIQKYGTTTTQSSKAFVAQILGPRTLIDRLRMVYIGAEGQDLFTSHAWRKRGARMPSGHFMGRLAEHFGWLLKRDYGD